MSDNPFPGGIPDIDGGEMGGRIHGYPWATTPLGPRKHWPAPLRLALGICLTSSFPTAIYWGPDFTLLYNDAWSPIPGERHPDALGKPAREVWTDIWSVVGPQFEEVVATGRGFSTFDQLLPMVRNGAVRETYWNYSLTPIFDEAGNVAGIFNQGHETTESIIAARTRLLETARLRELFEQAPGAIAILRGPNHVFEIANPAYFALSGRSKSVLGKPVAEAMPEVVGQGFVALLDNVYRTGEPHVGASVPVVLPRGPGGADLTRLVDFVYQPLRENGAITGIFVAATDVTERAAAEAEVQALNATLEQRVRDEVAERAKAEEQLRHAQKMEAIGQLTGGIAHDFNNMLAVVIGALNLLKVRLARGETDVARFVDAAMDGADRAASLTQRLLAFSRQQPLEPSTIDANRLVASMTELLGRTLGEIIAVETVLAAGLWKTFADPLQLENALINLSVNARDAMPDGGKLTIETGNISVDDDYAREFDMPAGQYVMIAVTDTGVGMSPETVARAFDPFFTTKAVGKGTGLGLSQVFGFVRQSGGHVRIYSEPGMGTSVKVYLPRYYGDAAPVEARRPGAPAGRGAAHEIVLVVEDEERVRTYSVEALRELGYTVRVASGPREALALIEAGEKISLLFTDVVMPDMTGRQLAHAARAHAPDLKVLFTTGYTRNAVVHNGVLDAGTNFLPKPFTLEQLAAKVRSSLDG